MSERQTSKKFALSLLVEIDQSVVILVSMVVYVVTSARVLFYLRHKSEHMRVFHYLFHF